MDVVLEDNKRKTETGKRLPSRRYDCLPKDNKIDKALIGVEGRSLTPLSLFCNEFIDDRFRRSKFKKKSLSESKKECSIKINTFESLLKRDQTKEKLRCKTMQTQQEFFNETTRLMRSSLSISPPSTSKSESKFIGRSLDFSGKPKEGGYMQIVDEFNKTKREILKKYKQIGQEPEPKKPRLLHTHHPTRKPLKSTRKPLHHPPSPLTLLRTPSPSPCPCPSSDAVKGGMGEEIQNFFLRVHKHNFSLLERKRGWIKTHNQGKEHSQKGNRGRAYSGVGPWNVDE